MFITPRLLLKNQQTIQNLRHKKRRQKKKTANLGPKPELPTIYLENRGKFAGCLRSLDIRRGVAEQTLWRQIQNLVVPDTIHHIFIEKKVQTVKNLHKFILA